MYMCECVSLAVCVCVCVCVWVVRGGMLVAKTSIVSGMKSLLRV